MPSVRIAIWSGPRNISSAMMRSWGNRADTFVVDEPLYAHYLVHSEHREEHPGADEIIANGETDWRKVVAQLTGEIPQGKTIFYQKHMTHHLLDHIELDWVKKLSNCFLLRNPREVIASFIQVIPNPTIDQLGLVQQFKLFEYVRQFTRTIPPVLDTADILRDPRNTLSRLCDVLNLPFDDAMLAWSPGRRETDGIWAKYWYSALEQSTGFASYQPKEHPIPDQLMDLLTECETIYQKMAVYRLT